MFWFYQPWHFTKKKLEMYGIADNKLHWFSSYLKNRQQMVFFQQFKEVYSGVPQGSVLGPLLF